jgi:hypothetical protein
MTKWGTWYGIYGVKLELILQQAQSNINSIAKDVVAGGGYR